MDQLVNAWAVLEPRRKLAVLVATLAAFGAMFLIWRLAMEEDMTVLYAGLEPATAGEVIANLEQQGVAFQILGGAIMVPNSMRDQTRLSLAAQGLPASGSIGYELLDNMSGFSTTSQIFDAAYWRAKEGELARTILTSPAVRAARVHIATPERQPFTAQTPVTASVTLTPAGDGIDPRTAKAIRYMVASAIAGLRLSDVAIIDTVNGILSDATAQDGADPTIADPREAQMKAGLERLLSARVGQGKAIVEVHVDADMDSQTITERVIDPASRVAISSDLEERTEDSTGGEGGAVTVASNLPDGDTEGAGAASSASVSETRERQNFEISETRRERVIQPGQIRRLSVAVIVDGITDIAADGTRTWTARSEDELAALRSLVEGAIGFDAARGDTVTIQSLEFPAPQVLGTGAPEASGFELSGNLYRIIQSSILALTALILGLFVIRPLLRKPPALPPPPSAVEVIDDDSTAGLDAEFVREQQPGQLENTEDQNKIRNLREVIKDRSEDSAEVLRRWIDHSERQGDTT